jgi:hypothetical protein
MSKIKYINCFGTSFTAGGGFEFDGISSGRSEFLKSFYSNLDVPQTQFGFSYPGHIQKLTNIKVNNYAKNGYGNDRTFRIIYDIITTPNFNNDEHIFLLEFGGIGRKEFWYEPLNDFIVMNYWLDWDTQTLKKKVDIAQSYCYDTSELEINLQKEESLFLEFHSKTFNFKNEIKKYEQEIDFFIAYLELNKIKYFLVNEIPNKNIDKYFIFGDGIYFKQSTDFNKFTHLNNLEIDIETNNQHKDKHNGYVSNKIIGETIYNSLINMGLIDDYMIDIDYEGLRNLKLPKRNTL